MLLATLSLALLANQQDAPRPAAPRVEHVAQASVQIIAAEEIRFRQQPEAQSRKSQQQRQHRIRGGMPMIEFY
jgi:hypothetical protein